MDIQRLKEALWKLETLQADMKAPTTTPFKLSTLGYFIERELSNIVNTVDEAISEIDDLRRNVAELEAEFEKVTQ